MASFFCRRSKKELWWNFVEGGVAMVSKKALTWATLILDSRAHGLTMEVDFMGTNGVSVVGTVAWLVLEATEATAFGLTFMVDWS